MCLNDCCPLLIAWLDLLWSSPSLRSCDNCSGGYLAYYEACLVEVVRVVILDAILGFDIGYQARPALDQLRILAEGSLVVVLAIELDCKLRATFDERASPVLANRWLVALCEQRVGHIHISESRWVSLLF